MTKFKSYSMKLAEQENKWYVIDAKDIVLGRLAVIIATRLRGKHKPNYTAHMDCGDNIIVVNADKVKVTGDKLNKNKFIWHTGYPGGLKEKLWKDILHGKSPEKLILQAVKRMISKGTLRNKQMKRLFVYPSESHQHEAQQPEGLNVSIMNPKNKR